MANNKVTHKSIFVNISGQLEKDDLNAKIGKMSNRIQQLKVDVFDQLNKRYAEFNPSASSLTAQGLSTRVQDVSNSMDDMAHKIEREVPHCFILFTSAIQSVSYRVFLFIYITYILEFCVS